RIIEFRTREITIAVNSPSDKHLPVGQERRGMGLSLVSHAARRSPKPGRRIIEFRSPESAAAVLAFAVNSPGHEHLAVGQKRRAMVLSLLSHAARRAPQSGRGIIELRAREKVAAAAAEVQSPRDEHLAVGQERRRVFFAWGGEAAGDGPGSV